MEGGIQSSFIPKDAGKATQAPRIERSGGLSDLILLISIVLFVASAALAGATFLYKQYLESSVTSKVDQLQRARQAFEPALIQDLTRLDDRMRASDSILTAHLAPTAFFAALGQATLSTVSFQTLDLEAGDPKNITVKMEGIARSVNSIALEADLMSKNGVVTSPIFSDISRQPDGVHFSLSALINPAAINYIAVESGQAGTPVFPQSATPTVQPTSVTPAEPAQSDSQAHVTPPATTDQSAVAPAATTPPKTTPPSTVKKTAPVTQPIPVTSSD